MKVICDYEPNSWYIKTNIFNISNNSTMYFIRFIHFISLLTISVLPSGSIYNFNVKYLLMGALLSCWLVSTLSRSKVLFRTTKMLLPFLFILSWALLGLTMGVPVGSILSHAVAILSVHLLVSVFTDYARDDNAWLRLSSWFCISAFMISIVKVLLWLLIFSGQLSVDDVWNFVDTVFGFKFITLETEFGSRLHFPIDFLLPISLLITSLQSPQFLKRNSIVRFLFIVLICFAILIAYSRLLWAFSLVFLFIWMRIYKGQASKFVLALIFLIPLLLIYPPIFDAVGVSFDFLSERFNGRHAETSDTVRAAIFVSLTEFFAKSPVIGSGLGSFAGLVRFPNLPWNYELQTYSWFGQFGIVGSFLIFFYLFNLISSINERAAMWPWLIIAWLLVCSVNCFLLTSQGAVILVALMCTSVLIAREMRVD